MPANRNDWRTTPLPKARASRTLERGYTAAEFARIREGRVPKEMEHRWFAFFEEPWLYVHRSWTGIGIFQVRFEQVRFEQVRFEQVRFEPTDGVIRVVEALVNRDPEEYGGTDDIADAQRLAAMLDGYAGRDTGRP